MNGNSLKTIKCICVMSNVYQIICSDLLTLTRYTDY